MAIKQWSTSTRTEVCTWVKCFWRQFLAVKVGVQQCTSLDAVWIAEWRLTHILCKPRQIAKQLCTTTATMWTLHIPCSQIITVKMCTEHSCGMFCAHSTRRTEAVQKQQLHVTSTHTFGANAASHKTSVHAASCYFTMCMALHYVTFLLSYIHNSPIQTIHNIPDHHF